MTRVPVLRVALVVAGTLGCAASTGGGIPEEQTVDVDVFTDRAVYARGDTVHLEITIRNRGPQPVTLHFASGQRYDFEIHRPPGTVLWRWSTDRGFIQVLGEEQIGPGEELFFGEPFDGTRAPGRYVVRGIIPARRGALTAETTFEVR